jgi:hypothetical protein
MARIKKFSYYVILNWRSGDVNLYKTPPADSKVGQYDKVIHHEIEIEAPAINTTKLSEEIGIPEAEIEETIQEHLPELDREVGEAEKKGMIHQ